MSHFYPILEAISGGMNHSGGQYLLCISYFKPCIQLVIPLNVTVGYVLEGAISGGADGLAGGSGGWLLVALRFLLGPGKMRLGGGWPRSALRLGGLLRRLGGSRGPGGRLRFRLGR